VTLAAWSSCARGPVRRARFAEWLGSDRVQVVGLHYQVTDALNGVACPTWSTCRIARHQGSAPGRGRAGDRPCVRASSTSPSPESRSSTTSTTSTMTAPTCGTSASIPRRSLPRCRSLVSLILHWRGRRHGEIDEMPAELAASSALVRDWSRCFGVAESIDIRHLWPATGHPADRSGASWCRPVTKLKRSNSETSPQRLSGYRLPATSSAVRSRTAATTPATAKESSSGSRKSPRTDEEQHTRTPSSASTAYIWTPGTDRVANDR
jgi:hypothetical protein